jgi:photosystem II stability/assembly factor-like uncharacterized protein
VQLTSVSKAPVGSNVAWICGYSGTVLRTTNSGQNWLNVSGGGIPNTVSLINIFALDLNNAITAGYTGTNTWVWKTTNAGVNWVQVFTETGGFIDAVWMTSNTQGIMMGNPVGGRWSLWRTSNGGFNWDSTGLYLPQAGSEAGWNNSMFCYQSNIWFGTNNTRVYYSSNNGSSWIAQPTTGEINSYSIWFYSVWPYDPDMANDNGLAGGATLMQTSNGGTNWLLLGSVGTGNFGGITGADIPVNNSLAFGFLWYVRTSNNIYFSLGGTGWIVEYTAPAGNYRHISQLYTNSGFWAVRTNGGISYHLPITGVNNTSSEIPSQFKLYQNFPNPFNPSTRIRFDIPVTLGTMDENVRLAIFDALGREVDVLVYEPLKAGSYDVGWDASKYPSGVYFYKLTAREFIETKKMMLLK